MPVTPSSMQSPVSESGTGLREIEDLPFDDRLKNELREWADDFEAAQLQPGPGPSSYRSVDAAEQFVHRGARLVEEDAATTW